MNKSNAVRTAYLGRMLFIFWLITAVLNIHPTCAQLREEKLSEDLKDLPAGFRYDGGAWLWRLDSDRRADHRQWQMRQLGWVK